LQPNTVYSNIVCMNIEGQKFDKEGYINSCRLLTEGLETKIGAYESGKKELTDVAVILNEPLMEIDRIMSFQGVTFDEMGITKDRFENLKKRALAIEMKWAKKIGTIVQ
jgi:hypothetical protein